MACPGHTTTRMCSQLVQREKCSRKSREQSCEVPLAAAWNSTGEATGLLHKQHSYFGGCLFILWRSKTGNGIKSLIESEFPEIIMAGANTCEHKVTNIRRKSDSSQYGMVLWDKQPSLQ